MKHILLYNLLKQVKWIERVCLVVLYSSGTPETTRNPWKARKHFSKSRNRYISFKQLLSLFMSVLYSSGTSETTRHTKNKHSNLIQSLYRNRYITFNLCLNKVCLSYTAQGLQKKTQSSSTIKRNRYITV